MEDKRMENPCLVCKHTRTCKKNGNYFRLCSQYRAWICWNWAQFKAGFYALKAKQEGGGGQNGELASADTGTKA